MAIYKSTDADFFQQSIASVLDQTVPADEIVIVVDGPIGDALEAILADLVSPLFTIVRLGHNQGLGLALKHAIEASTADFVFRMDDDDIALPDRFRLQIEAITANPEISVLGGQIVEFDDSQQGRLYIRACPTDPAKIRHEMRRRNVVNHVTCLLNRQAVLDCGNYRVNTIGYEDYELWMRMLNAGKTIVNLDSVLVKVRFSERQYRSRFGLKPARHELAMQVDFLRKGHIGMVDLLLNLVTRFLPRLLPISIAKPIFLGLLRKRYREEMR